MFNWDNKYLYFANIVTLGVLTTVNIVLYKQNAQLKAELEKANTKSTEIAQGATLPAIRGSDQYGVEKTISYGEDEKKTLLLGFSPACGYCKQNQTNWQQIISQIDNRALRVVAVSIREEGVAKYTIQNGFNSIPVIASMSPESRMAYKLQKVPQTILISSTGVVEKVWVGVIDKTMRGEIKKYLGVELTSDIEAPPPDKQTNCANY